MDVPKLRFKEFSDEYIKIKLNTQSEFLNGLTYTPNDVDDNGIIVLRSSNIQNSKIDYTDIVKVNMNVSQKMKIHENDILMCVRNGSKSLVGKTAWLSKNEEKCTWGAFMNIIRPKENNKYIYYYLNSKYFYNHIWKDLGTATVNQITKKTLDDCFIKIPSINEQNKVSNFLSILDKKINLQSKKIEDLKLFKKGLYKINNNMELSKISMKEILSEVNEKTTVNNQYNILSSTSKGLFLQKDYFNKQAASDNNIGYKILKKGQLVLSPQNLWMGNININNKFDIGMVSPSYKIFDINKNKINIKYFENWIKSPRALYEYMISSEQGASVVRRNLNIDLFYEITIDVPNEYNQMKIGDSLKKIDDKINLELNKLQNLQKLKKGLMQDMFV